MESSVIAVGGWLGAVCKTHRLFRVKELKEVARKRINLGGTTETESSRPMRRDFFIVKKQDSRVLQTILDCVNRAGLLL